MRRKLTEGLCTAASLAGGILAVYGAMSISGTAQLETGIAILAAGIAAMWAGDAGAGILRERRRHGKR